MDQKIANLLALAQLYVSSETERNPHDAFYRAVRELHPMAAGMIRQELIDAHSDSHDLVKHRLTAPSLDWTLHWLLHHPALVT